MVQVVRNKKSNRVLIGVIIFMFVALLIVTIAVIVISGRKAQQEIGTNPTEQQSSEEQNSGDEEDEGKEESNESNSGENGEISGEVDENDENKITGNIDYRALVGDTLSIRTTINELFNDGTCSLTITGPHEQVYKLTDKIIPNSASTSTCVGFDINMDLVEKDEERRAGKWTITIDLASGGRTGQLVSEMTL